MIDKLKFKIYLSFLVRVFCCEMEGEYLVLKWCVSVSILLGAFCFETRQCNSDMKIKKIVQMLFQQISFC